MNLLAHLYVTEYSHTSYANQALGDIVKGDLGRRYVGPVGRSIPLRRAKNNVSSLELTRQLGVSGRTTHLAHQAQTDAGHV